jgi:hypothetical protein
MSDRLIKEMDELRDTIDPNKIVQLKLITPKVIGAQKELKKLSKNVKSRYQKAK